jgi:hypothetical protein
MNNYTAEEWATSTHEAAHFVAARCVGHGSATLEPQRSRYRRVGNRVVKENLSAVYTVYNRHDPRAIFREAVVSFAGPIAEQRQRYGSALGVQTVTTSTAIDAHSQERARSWAARIVHDNWQEITRGANVLIAERTIGQEQVDACIERQAEMDAFFHKAYIRSRAPRPRPRRPMRGYVVGTK